MSEYRNSNFKNTPVAFMVRHEDKNGNPYWKATMDLGGGKAVKLMMFENQKEGTKSDFIVNGHKKSYNKKPRQSNRTTW